MGLEERIEQLEKTLNKTNQEENRTASWMIGVGLNWTKKGFLKNKIPITDIGKLGKSYTEKCISEDSPEIEQLIWDWCDVTKNTHFLKDPNSKIKIMEYWQKYGKDFNHLFEERSS